MNLLEKYFFRTLLILTTTVVLSCPESYTQIPAVDGNRAVYTRVEMHWSQFNNNTDTLLVTDPSGFSIGDTVLFHHTISGDPYEDGGGAWEGKIALIRNAGIYAIFLIDTIDGNRIALNNILPKYGAWDHVSGDYGQLIKIPTYNKARLTSSFSFPSWDPVTGTGGIFPILINKKLILESDFSANGKGFKGAQASGDYVSAGGVCSVDDPDLFEDYFHLSDINKSALKGSGFHNLTVNLVDSIRGKGRIGIAGGGGNGKYSGGGGGGNRGSGGKGGKESDACLNYGDIGGIGGQSMTYKTDVDDAYGNRIHMGGGGGSGTQSPSLSRIASGGGSGGGIIIIITDTLEAVGSKVISANGQSVTGIANAGGGGGGGGGVLILEVANYVGNIELQVKGGDGGNILPDPDITGPGGGGGGGIIQHNNLSLPGNVTVKIAAGKSGVVNGTINKNGAFDGGGGDRQGELLIPIMGFIINTIPDDLTICEGQSAPVLNAPKPKGASGNYIYTWLQSSDTINWVPAVGINNEVTYQTPANLTDTTYYRRYVQDVVNAAISDSGFFMAVNVHPKIQNNLIVDDDTVCFNLAPESDLTSVLSLSGGYGGYNFIWEKSPDNASFSSADGTSNGFSYTSPALTDTTWYRRIVRSGACYDTSNVVKISVLAALNDLNITEDQFLCNNQDAITIEGNVPGGGQPGDKRYEWYETVGGSRNLVATTKDYHPLALTAETYRYRRLVYSGSENACIDSSNQVTIMVYPDITGNSISTPQDTICTDLPGMILDGTLPSGGKTGDYSYYWEISPNGVSSWTDGATDPSTEDLQSESLSSTSWFRRTVYSASTDSACFSVSNIVKVEVLPALVNTMTTPDDTICQYTSSPLLTGNPASGGHTGNYTYRWESRKDDTGWASASGTFDDVNYNPGILDDTTYYFFRRVVLSGPANTCQDFSDSIAIMIQPSIKDNFFADAPGIDVCFGTEAFIDGIAISGGDGSRNYSWQDSINGGTWQTATGISDNEDYTNNSLTNATWYRRIATSGKCIDTSDPFLADTLSLPVLNGLILSHDTICHDQTDFYLILDIRSEEGNPSDYSFSYADGVNSSTPATISNKNDSINITGFLPFTAYNYSISSLTDGNGCTATGNYSFTLPLWVNKAPIPGISKPGDPFMVCGSVFELTSVPDTNPGVSEGYWTVDHPTVNVDDAGASVGVFRHSFEDFDSTSLKVLFHQETNSCGSRADTLLVKLYEQPLEPVIEQGESMIVFLSENTSISAEPPTAGFTRWSVVPDDVNLEDNGLSAYLSNLPFGIETIARFTIENGNCEVVSSDILIERREVHVFEGLSPENVDGKNDFLVAEGLEAEGVSFTFQIFSTNGMMVRELTNEDVDRLGFATGLPNNGRVLWDGKTKGENKYVPEGTYYYVLIINYQGTEFIDKGFVVVK